MNEIKKLIEESVGSLFEKHADSDAIEIMESGGFPTTFWDEFSEGGWRSIALTEDEGGAGMGLAGGYILMRLSGYHAVPLPIVESIISVHLLALAGAPLTDGFTALAVADAGFQVDGTSALPRVPWARHASNLVVIMPGENNTRIALVDRDKWTVKEHTNMAGEPRDDVLLANDALGELFELPGVSTERILSWLALGRAAQMTGALSRILECTVEYANERKQFGRLISKFQALQQQISVQAEHVNAAQCAVDAGILHLNTPHEWECIAAAKIRTGEAVGHVCRIAHAVHAAIGFTREYPLQLSTRRSWSWRDEYGNEAWWATKLGDLCLGLERGQLWSWLSEQTNG